ncbi:hypothetical protein F5148DRAFT_223858 [Russula earlei]|uniref:Uncharacterized protein n=1 Tax=Russula earlei TaxID=71964 RepID=A0ACC0U4I6_9AGAM|nr:hypothetical protein F5148DRAFT_223858 [Russula earlei]
MSVDATGEALALIKSWHAFSGLYIWEFVLNLDYEHSIIARKRPFMWTSLLFIGCRWCTLLVIILELLALDMSYKINCQAAITLGLVFTMFSFLSTSALIILRVYALCERNRIIIAFASVVWSANVACYIYGVSTTRAQYIEGRCMTQDHILHTRTVIFPTFFTDIILLVLMVAGVFRWNDVRGRSTILSLLYKQSLVWVVIYTLVGVPPLIFIILNLNDIMNQMFIIPGVVLKTICASRMHLALVNSTSPPLGAVTPVTEFKAGVGFPASPHRGHLTEGIYNTGSQLPALNVLIENCHQEFVGAFIIE